MRGGNNMTEPSQYFKGRTVQEQMDEVIGYVDTRAAEVATAAIASDVAQVHQDMLDADADAQAAAASAAAAAGTLANAVKKVGEASQSIAGDIAVAGTLSGGVVTGTQVTVPTPVNNTDAANKKYVDDADALKLDITDVGSYAVLLTGNQGPILGLKKMDTPAVCRFRSLSLNDATGWYKVMEFTVSGSPLTSVLMVGDRNNNTFGILKIVTQNAGSFNIKQIAGDLTNTEFKLARTADRTKAYLFHKGSRFSANAIYANYAWMDTSMVSTADIIAPTDNDPYAEPVVGDDWSGAITWS